ncbi:MAG: thiamine pyrophosphate-binding protein, partial [Thermoplasmata archaeon]
MRSSEIFEKFIEENGLYPVFGNPGTTEIPMLRNIKNYYLTLHDSLSVAMAEGRSDFTGKPSVVNLHSLPGISNSMAFIYSAFKNRSPIIITAGQQDRRHLFYDPLLSGEQIPMVDGYVKYAYEIREINEIPLAMRRAAEIAMEPPMGPVFLSFPMDLMDGTGNYKDEKPFYYDHEVTDEKSTKEIADRINESKKIAIVYGYEIDAFGGYAEASKFADYLNAAFFTESWPSRSVIDKENPHYYGNLPMTAAGINLALRDFDLVLFIGGDIFIYPYTQADPLSGKECIFIGFDLTHRTGKSYSMNPVSFMRSAIKYINPKTSFERKKLPEPAVASDILKRAARHFSDYSIVDEAVTASAAVQRYLGNIPKGYFASKAG